nr:MAG TPA: hypothetical protein [Caudoviricetes sp.]
MTGEREKEPPFPPIRTNETGCAYSLSGEREVSKSILLMVCRDLLS